ncbi:DUF3859 domain-containing protein [Sagittula sp. SSi028]|uniref:DUF3859 domain-containing protein n=1 Tax=Sagittula sp. SSi028 TaxID=3400636 RepID=UPI003AF51D5D
MRLMFPALMSCLLPHSAVALDIIEHGVICDAPIGRPVPAPDTVSGILNTIEQGLAFDVTTTVVPAELGLTFGIRAALPQGSPAIDLTVVVTHPPMGPSGQQVESWPTTVYPDAPALNLFTFEEPFELIEGPWHFALMQGEETLAEKQFTITPKGTAPEVQSICFGAMILS